MTTRRAEWIGMLTTVCFVLGGLVALSVKTQQAVRAGVPGIPVTSSSSELAHEWETMQQKIQTLQAEVNKLHLSGYTSTDTEHLALQAGTLAVNGPGIRLTLADNPHLEATKADSGLPTDINYGLIHDVDVLRVVNELFAAGAEAISVDGQRIGPRTAIRCVGPVVNVNQVGCAEPFQIDAIGDPNTLERAMQLPGGIIQDLRGVGCQIEIGKRTDLKLPAYDATVLYRFAKQSGSTASNGEAQEHGQ